MNVTSSQHGPTKRDFRHSKRSTKILKAWFTSHSVHPYPTDEEKEELSETTGLTRRQVACWFVNARRRNGFRLGQGSDSSDSIADSALIPTECEPHHHQPVANVQVLRDGMTPLDRWRNSPPEEEPAPWDAINQSLGNCLPSCASAPDLRRAAAPESVFNLSISSDSSASAHSYSSESLLGIQSNYGRKKRRQRRRTMPTHPRRLDKAKDDDERQFQCTFCTDRFTTRYDWTRHEATIHLVLEKWTCLPFGPRIDSPHGDSIHCAFCDKMNPTDAHLESHQYTGCVAKPLSKRSFYRRDHLRQHLRVAHGVHDILPSMKHWKSKVTKIKCRCGFCGETFSLWSDRNDHLADHFRSGTQMKDWTGCRGLEPAVALLVQHAIPPYLIGAQSNDVEPFSGSRVALRTGESGTSLPTNFESLTARLGEFVRRVHAQGMEITDDMLRKEARILLYDDDDPLNDTPADNMLWLDLFKQGYGLAKPPGGHDNFTTAQNPQNFQLDRSGASSFQDLAHPFTLERMRQAAVSDSTTIPLDLCDSILQEQAGGDMAVPWSWQTPECLAEFSQMCEMPPTCHGLLESAASLGTFAECSDYPVEVSDQDTRIDRCDGELEDVQSDAVLLKGLDERNIEEIGMGILFHEDSFQHLET